MNEQNKYEYFVTTPQLLPQHPKMRVPRKPNWFREPYNAFQCTKEHAWILCMW